MMVPIKLNLAGVNLTYLRVFSFSVAQANGDDVVARENFRPCFFFVFLN